MPKSLQREGMKIDPLQFWQEIDAFEHLTRKDAQKARELQISLHHKLPLEENINLLKKFIEEQFVSLGMIADVVIHKPEDNPKNIHAHVMLSLRELIQEDDGIRFGKKIRSWNDRKLLVKCREEWEKYSNDVLSRFNLQNVTSKSYAALYEEAKKENNIENMELYSKLMCLKTHFSQNDILKNENILILRQEEKKRIFSEVKQKYNEIRLDDKNGYNAPSKLKSRNTRKNNAINFIEQNIKSTVYRIGNRIRYVLIRFQQLRKGAILQRIRAIGYPQRKTRSMFRPFEKDKKYKPSSYGRIKPASSHLTEWLPTPTLDLSDFGIRPFANENNRSSSSNSTRRFSNRRY